MCRITCPHSGFAFILIIIFAYEYHLCACACLLVFVAGLTCACVCVRPSSSPFAAVISAHPIHSLDNHHHHYHMGSLASPTRSYFYHPGSGHPRPHACATPISHLDRVDSSGERLPPAGRRRRSGHVHPFVVHSCSAAIIAALLHL